MCKRNHCYPMCELAVRFSIVVPTRNRPRLLDECLAAMGALDYPHEDFEIMVVDDGSDPPPLDVIARHVDTLQLRCLRWAPQGPARARNYGLRHATGDYIVFTDDDCAPAPGWLKAFDRAFESCPSAGLGGPVLASPKNGIYGVASQMLVTFLYEYAKANPGQLTFFCSNNLAFPRRSLLDLGGFDETFPLAAGEDRELCDRWIVSHELYFAPAAVVSHRQDLNLVSFCAQHFRYGRGAFHFWAIRQARGGAGLRVQSWRFYWKMLGSPFTREKTMRAMGVSFLLALSQVVNAAGYAAERWKRRRANPGGLS